MRHEYQFAAYGHPNIRSKHKTTLMTTVENKISTRGDCIIGVAASIGLDQLPEEIKKVARDLDTKITFTLKTENNFFKAQGKGHPRLTYKDPIDIVVRKSSYTCDRTLMIHSDKAAVDISSKLVSEMQNPDTEITINLIFKN